MLDAGALLEWTLPGEGEVPACRLQLGRGAAAVDPSHPWPELLTRLVPARTKHPPLPGRDTLGRAPRTQSHAAGGGDI